MSLNLTLSLITLFSVLSLGIFVLYEDYNNKTNQTFFFLCLSIITWIIGNLFANIFISNTNISLLFIRSSVIGAVFIPVLFSKLINALYEYSSKYIPMYNNINKISYIFIAIVIILNQTSINIKSINIEEWGISFVPGVLYYFLFIYFIISFSFPFIYLFDILKKSNHQQKSQIRYIMIGSGLSIFISIIICIILPMLNSSYLSIFSTTVPILFISIISYAITKHHLFNMKVIAIEIVTFGLWVFVLFRALTAEDISEFYIEAGILLIAIVFGIMLIRTIIHEILQREKIEELTEKLDIAYKEIEELNISIEEKEFSGVSKK